MRTYEETYERILSKKIYKEAKMKEEKKKRTRYIITSVCSLVCLTAVILTAKGTIDSTAVLNRTSDLYVNDFENTTQQASTSGKDVTEPPKPDKGGLSFEEENGLSELNADESYRIAMVGFAMKAISTDDYRKIKSDKSYIVSRYTREEEQGKDCCVIHLEGDSFYYEVEIDAAGEKVYNSKRIEK